MNGRLEISEKDFQICNNLTAQMPDYIKAWYTDMRAAGASAKSCKDYLHKANDFLTTLGDDVAEIKASDITSNAIKNYLISKQTVTDSQGNLRTASKSYQKCLWSCLNSLTTFLVDDGYLDSNPVKPGSRPGGSDLERINEHRVLLTSDDFNAILNSVDKGAGSHKAKTFQAQTKARDTAIMRLFMCTGLRESALASVNVEDIDFENSTLFIYDKGDVPHKFILTDKCVIAIKEWMEQMQITSGALFITLKGDRMHVNSITKLVKKFTEDALGKALSPHKLRAGVCSILYTNTKDIEFVRRFIGHSDVSITKRYIVTKGDEIKKGNEILTSLIG